MTIIVRHAEVSDAEAIQRIHAQPKVVWGTLQLPFPSVELWRNRIASPPEGSHNLVACVDTEVVGQLGLWIYPGLPRRRHVGGLGMAVHDEWQQKGIGTALMEAAISLADRWLNLIRLELDVYVDNETAVKLYEKVWICHRRHIAQLRL